MIVLFTKSYLAVQMNKVAFNLLILLELSLTFYL